MRGGGAFTFLMVQTPKMTLQSLFYARIKKTGVKAINLHPSVSALEKRLVIKFDVVCKGLLKDNKGAQTRGVYIIL